MVGPGVLEHRACSDRGENSRLPKPEEGSGGRGMWGVGCGSGPCARHPAASPGLQPQASTIGS